MRKNVYLCKAQLAHVVHFESPRVCPDEYQGTKQPFLDKEITPELMYPQESFMILAFGAQGGSMHLSEIRKRHSISLN